MKIQTPDGFILDAKVNLIPNSTKAIIFCHGITHHKHEFPFVAAEKDLNQAGISTTRFDFRTHGKSSGNSITDFSIKGEITDIKTIYDYLTLHGIKNISLAGASFGASIVSLFADQYKNLQIKSIVLIYPLVNYQSFPKPNTKWTKKYFTNMRRQIENQGFIAIGSSQFKLGKNFINELEEYADYRFLADYRGLLLVIAGEKDTYVSLTDIKNWFNKLSNPNKNMVILPDAEHGFAQEPFTSQAANLIFQFFQKNL